jgi:hypothetical protein
MKANINNLFSLSMREGEYFNNKQEKFELVSCPIKEKFCKELRPAINKDYLVAQQFYLNKDYQKSIESLKSAYSKTWVLKEHACANCAKLFRVTISQSLENIQNEQHKTSFSLFRSKRYQLDSLQLDPVLKEIKYYSSNL